MSLTSAPTPEFRIVPTHKLLPHEDHDSQRSEPLIERIRAEAYMINPPIVAPMDDGNYVILDGANRVFAFSALEYPHILVQVAAYASGFVELETWHHLVCAWNKHDFIQEIKELPEIEMVEGQHSHAIAHIMFRDEQLFALLAPVETIHERNAALRQFVRVHQTNAVLHRTALNEPHENWRLFPDAIALVFFPRYQPADIMAAAKHRAFLPPGVSRHIVHGRAVRVNFPIDILCDMTTSLEAKNDFLLRWMQDKLAKRHVRYYAEATYQFDE
ncbi:MAG TPA: hypothetical protein VK003_15020 [Oceanobacillus sp.]|nr:hypothetical protein [Oceanobacillus sp.]